VAVGEEREERAGGCEVVGVIIGGVNVIGRGDGVG